MRTSLACAALVAPAALAAQAERAPLRRIEDFRLDADSAAVADGRARYARGTAMQAYLYQLPAFLHLRQLSEFIQGREYMAKDEPPLGGWVLVRTLSTPKTTNVLPNVDTFYGASYVWLGKQGPVVLSVPAIADRYYSVALHDAWFNVFAIVGTKRTGTAAGHYLIVPPGWRGRRPVGITRVLEAPTQVINLYQRIYVRHGDDPAAIHRLQDAITLTSFDRWRTERRGVTPVDVAQFRIPALREVRDPLLFFELTNRYSAIAAPPPRERALVGQFATIGLGPGASLPADAPTRAAIAAGAADAQAAIDATIAGSEFRDGWRLPDPRVALAGPWSLSRATMQLTQIGSLPADEAMYFVSFRDGDGRPLDGTRPARLTFAPGARPPVDRGGFWSLTMYDARGLLVENEIARYVVRPDTPALLQDADGSLTIALQPDRPGDVARGNWLPTPRGPYQVVLRLYLPQAAVREGRWLPPAIRPAP